MEKMQEKIKLHNFDLLSDKELQLIEGGDLSELTEKALYYVSYGIGWLSSRNWGGTPAHESALLGPNSRPTG